MTWNDTLFPTLPIPVRKSAIRGSTGVMTHYNYRFDPKLGEGKCAIQRITCACTFCIGQLNKAWIPKIDDKDQPWYAHVPNCKYNAIFGNFNDWIIIEFVNKTHTKKNLTMFTD